MMHWNLVRTKLGRRRNRRCDDSPNHPRPAVPAAKCGDPNARASASLRVQGRQWQLLRELLLSVERADAACSCPGNGCAHDLAKEDALGRTVLHEICASRPPVDVVRTVLRMFPDMATGRDEMGRRPLHVAIESEASMNVIQSLVKSNPKCTEAQDQDGKTPLMLACEQVGRTPGGGEPRRAGPAPEELIEFLLSPSSSSSSQSVLLEDCGGRTALEIALVREAPAYTVAMLQKITKRAQEEKIRERKTTRLGKMAKSLSRRASRSLRNVGGSTRSLRNVGGSTAAQMVAASA